MYQPLNTKQIKKKKYCMYVIIDVAFFPTIRGVQYVVPAEPTWSIFLFSASQAALQCILEPWSVISAQLDHSIGFAQFGHRLRIRFTKSI